MVDNLTPEPLRAVSPLARLPVETLCGGGKAGIQDSI